LLASSKSKASKNDCGAKKNPRTKVEGEGNNQGHAIRRRQRKSTSVSIHLSEPAKRKRELWRGKIARGKGRKSTSSKAFRAAASRYYVRWEHAASEEMHEKGGGVIKGAKGKRGEGSYISSLKPSRQATDRVRDDDAIKQGRKTFCRSRQVEPPKV